MLKTKTIERICCAAAAVMLALSVLLWGVVEPANASGSRIIGYEGRLFDQSTVHTINITMSGWDAFIANATAEEYAECSLEIDGEKYNNVAIRAKGNTSLSSVSTLGSTRYSFKVEFDHYVKGKTYYGLDKLSLNNLIQDATMMKDYLAYTLMNRMGVPSTLCSYVQINVNGEPWGLYLAVEGVEDSFLDRNGMTKGELYKPDSLSFGGGRGNGRGFDMEQFRVKDDEETEEASETAPETAATQAPAADEGGSFGGSFGMPAGGDMPSNLPDTQGQADAGASSGMPSGGEMPQGGDFSASSGESAQADPASESAQSEEASQENGRSGRGRPDGGFFDFSGMGGEGGGFGGFNFGMGSNDVKLIYSDDDPDSYNNIFNNAKTKVNKKDKARLIETLRKLNAQEDIDSVVNTDEVIRYLAVHNFLCNDDSYTGMMVHNYYLYEEKGQLSIIPWDYNLGFGGFSSSSNATSTVNSPIDSPVSGGTVDSRPLIAWIFSDEDSLAAYHEAYNRFLEENIENGWLDEEIVRVKEMISTYVENDPSAFYDMDTFETVVETLRAFCAKRGESIRGQLDGTIPSTSAGQKNSDALIDASDLSTASMGSMNGSGGGGMGNMPSFSTDSFTMPDSGQMPDGFTMPDGAQMPEGFTMPDNAQMPDMGGGASFGGSAGDSADIEDNSASPSPSSLPQTPEPGSETAQPAAGDATDQPGESRREPPQNMPGGGSFPGFETPQDQTGSWIQIAVGAILLLLALLVISRVRAHNE